MHNQKLKGAGAVRILDHIFRDRPGTKSNIDPNKTQLNYSLIPADHRRDTEYFTKLRDEVGVKRKDQVTLVDTVVTLPQELLELSDKDKERFFSAAGAFLIKRYCPDIKYFIAAQVHMDETTPHMHFAFMPVRDGRFNAKSIITRQDLRTLHDDMESHLCKTLPIVQPGYIKNGATIGVKTVDQLRQKEELEKEISDLKQRRDDFQVECELIQQEISNLNNTKTELLNEVDDLASKEQDLSFKVTFLREEQNTAIKALNSLKEQIMTFRKQITSFYEPLKRRIINLSGKIPDPVMKDLIEEHRDVEKEISLMPDFEPDFEEAPAKPKKRPKSR